MISARHVPFKTRKPRIITIESDPLTTGLNGQCREPSIGHQVAMGFGFGTKARKDLPMPLPRLNDHTVGLSKQDVAEPEYFIQPARFNKDLWVCSNADYPAQYLRSHAVTRVAIDNAREPDPASVVLR